MEQKMVQDVVKTLELIIEYILIIFINGKFPVVFSNHQNFNIFMLKTSARYFNTIFWLFS
jgi:hypothetical protein